MAKREPIINSQNIHYLAFEGGGGKGNAFLGALKALEEKKVLVYTSEGFLDNNRIRGISGASAGAITAMLVGLGYNFEEIRKILSEKDFFQFFDVPTPGKKLKAYLNNSKITSDEEAKKNYETYLKADPYYNIEKRAVKFFLYYFLFKKEGNEEIDEATKKVIGILKKNIEKHIDSIVIDKGAFEGLNILLFFNDLIVKKLSKHKSYKKLPTGWITFEDFYNLLNIDLKFTSVNLQTYNLNLLSYETTPKLPLAFAVRMSMSLPFIFKPIIITQEFAKIIGYANLEFSRIKSDKEMIEIWEGIWLDGGLLDNAPIRYFPEKESIMLRLGNRSLNNKTIFFLDFIKAYLLLGLFGGGSNTITETTYGGDNIIQLDLLLKNGKEIGMFDFGLEKNDLDFVTNNNYAIVKKRLS